MGRVASACVGLLLLVAIGWLVLRDDAPHESARTTAEVAQGEPVLKTKGVAKQPADGSAPVDIVALRGGFASDDPVARKAAYATAAQAEYLPFDVQLAEQMVAWLESHDKTLAHYAYVVLLRMGPKALPFTEPLLRSAVDDARFRALTLYGGWMGRGFEVAYPPLLPLLQDRYYPVQRMAEAYVSRGIPYDEDIAAWLKDRIDPSPTAAWAGPEVALSRMGDEGFAYVVSLLDDPKLRYNALGGLRGAPPEKLRTILPRLAAIIDDEDDEHAQVQALYVLMSLEGDCEELLPVFERALGRESYEVRMQVLMALEQMGERAAPAIDGLLVALEDSDERIAARAAGILGELESEPKRVLPALRHAMDGDGGDVAAAALGSFGEAALPYLKDALDAGDEDVRYFALYGVAALGPQAEPLVERVITLLDIDDFELQVRAAATLGKLGAAGAPGIPHILALLHDETLTPGSTAGILMGIGKPAEAALLEELRKQDAAGQLRVLEVLSAFHGRSAFALEALRPFLGFADVRVRRMALQAIVVSTWKDRWTHGAWPKSDPAVRRRVRGLIAGLVGDPDPALRKTAERALANLDAVER